MHVCPCEKRALLSPFLLFCDIGDALKAVPLQIVSGKSIISVGNDLPPGTWFKDSGNNAHMLETSRRKLLGPHY